MAEQPPSFLSALVSGKILNYPRRWEGTGRAPGNVCLKEGRGHTSPEDGSNKKCAPCRQRWGIALGKKMNDRRLNHQNWSFLCLFLRFHQSKMWQRRGACVSDFLHFTGIICRVGRDVKAGKRSCEERGAASLELFSISGCCLWKRAIKERELRSLPPQLLIFLCLCVKDFAQFHQNKSLSAARAKCNTLNKWLVDRNGNTLVKVIL